MPEKPIAPRKAPRQARASATVEVILEAATRVLAAHSLAGFNTNRVAEVAGISVGSLYQYFPNKAALVAVLIAREQAALGDAIERCLAVGEGKSLDSLLAELVDIAIEHQFGRAVYAAALDHEEERLPLGSVLSASQQRIRHALAALLDQHRPSIATDLQPTAAEDCLIIVKALIDSEGEHRAPDVPLLRVRVLRALWGYLRYSSAPSF